MNCQRAQELLCPYLDNQLAGTQMLEMQCHLSACPGCAHEYEELRQVKFLLRSLGGMRPALKPETVARAVREQAVRPSTWTPRPQRMRGLATAVGLSCLAVFSAAAPFAPAGLELASGRFSRRLPSAHAAQDDILLLPPLAAPDDLAAVGLTSRWTNLTPAVMTRLETAPARQFAPPPDALDAAPLDDPAVRGFAQGDLTLISAPAR